MTEEHGDSLFSKLNRFRRYQLTRQPAQGPIPETELGIHYLDFSLDTYYQQVHEASNRLPITVLDTIQYQVTDYPIYQIDKTTEQSQSRVLVLPGFHGNEQAAIQATIPILNDINQNPDIYRNTAIRIITPVNPVGAAYQSRYNGQGIDINRDWAVFESKEVQLVKDSVTPYAPNFVISLHEGPQESGTFFYTNRFVPQHVAKTVLNELEQNSVSLTEVDYYGRRLKTKGVSPVGRAFELWNAATKTTLGVRTMGDYLTKKGIPVITVETPWRNTNTEERINPHLHVIRGVVSQLNH